MSDTKTIETVADAGLFAMDAREVAVRQDQPIATSSAPIVSQIMALAASKDVNPEMFDRLVAWQEREQDRQAERDFSAAFGRLSTDLPRVKKNGTIDLGVDKQTGKARGQLPFAKWEDIDAAIRPLMIREGFTLSFDSVPRTADGGGLIVTGRLTHASGHSRTASMPLALDTGPGRNNLQAMGSTLSYGKRYCAEMLLNIVREGQDDDGKSGGTQFITEEQVTELVDLCKRAGRKEGDFVARLFSGAIHSFDEIEVGSGFLAAKSTLMGIINQKQAKKD